MSKCDGAGCPQQALPRRSCRTRIYCPAALARATSRVTVGVHLVATPWRVISRGSAPTSPLFPAATGNPGAIPWARPTKTSPPSAPRATPLHLAARACLTVSPAAAQGAPYAQDAATAAAAETTCPSDVQKPLNELGDISNNSSSNSNSSREWDSDTGSGGGGSDGAAGQAEARRRGNGRKRQGRGAANGGGSDSAGGCGGGNVYEQLQGSTDAFTNATERVDNGADGSSSNNVGPEGRTVNKSSSSSSICSGDAGSSSVAVAVTASINARGKAPKKSKSASNAESVDCEGGTAAAAVATASGEEPNRAAPSGLDSTDSNRDGSDLHGAIGGAATPSEAAGGGAGGGGGGDVAQRVVKGGGGKVAPGGGGRPLGGSAQKGGGGGGGKSLADRIRACRSVEELVALYDTVQHEAAAAARRSASEAGAAAAAAGLAAGAAGLPATTVWMFLAAAGELVAGWRARIPAGYRTARLREAREMRAQLSRLLSESCAVVLWAERLPPAKVCLLLSLMVVAGGRHRGAEQHLGLLVEDSLNSLEQYSSGEVALAASSFARLRYFPGRGWLDTLIEATTGQLSRWRPIDLGFLIWALAKWKAKAPGAWLHEYYAAFEGCGERVTERELALVCWAIGVGAVEGGPRPPSSFTNRVMVEVQVRLPSLGSQGLAHVAWGLCCCDVKPPKFWLRDFTQAAKAAMPYASNGLSFSNLLWALAMWQAELHPGEQLLGEACKHSARWLHTLDSRSLAVLLLALSDLGHTPPLEWVSLALETAHRKLATTDPSTAVAVLWAISRFERQRAAETAATAAAVEAAAAAGNAAAGAVPLPPRRRRLSSLTPEELLLVADDLVFGFGFGADGRTPGASAGTPLALRPPRKWLVRYSPLIKDFAMAAAGVVPRPTRSTSSASVASAAPSTTSPGADAAGGTAAGSTAASPSRGTSSSSRFAFSGLDSNQMLDLAVALADLYVYPGDTWMAAHEAHMALLGAAGSSSGGGRGGSSGRGGSAGAGAGLTPYQWQLLMASYAALDDTAEEYAAPKAGEMY